MTCSRSELQSNRKTGGLQQVGTVTAEVPAQSQESIDFSNKSCDCWGGRVTIFAQYPNIDAASILGSI